MATLKIPAESKTITSPEEIRSFLAQKGVFFDQWDCQIKLQDNSTQEEILEAYKGDLEPFMVKGGYQTADVISINSTTEGYQEIRAKFLAEHVHTEDEIRFFIDGEGLFWFHLEECPVFFVHCEKGDLISVPAGTKHWFDAGENDPFVKCIRVFTEKAGWTPHYTNSNIEKIYESHSL